MGPLEIVARCHAAAAQVAQMPSTPHPADRDLRRWETLREMRAELDPLVLARAVAAVGARHSCSLLACPWGRRGEPPEDVYAAECVPAELIAYCDGSGTQAHLPCGAGVVILDGDDVVLESSRSLGLGSNNHAELSAIRVALAVTDVPGWRARPLVVRTDSMYAIGALTAPEAPAPERPNARLIIATRRLLAGRSVRFEHVRGHAGEPGNERADFLAGLARRRQIHTHSMPSASAVGESR